MRYTEADFNNVIRIYLKGNFKYVGHVDTSKNPSICKDELLFIYKESQLEMAKSVCDKVWITCKTDILEYLSECIGSSDDEDWFDDRYSIGVCNNTLRILADNEYIYMGITKEPIDGCVRPNRVIYTESQLNIAMECEELWLATQEEIFTFIADYFYDEEKNK